MLTDDTGTKYVTTHACFGKPCDPEELKVGRYVPMPEGAFIQKTQPYGPAEQLGDKEAGYPTELTPKEWRDLKYPKFNTPLEKRIRQQLRLERYLEEAAKRPAYRVPDSVINDWTGDKYTTTHACFGRPCDPDELKEGRYVPLPEGSFV
jgi:hypothetical protein